MLDPTSPAPIRITMVFGSPLVLLLPCSPDGVLGWDLLFFGLLMVVEVRD